MNTIKNLPVYILFLMFVFHTSCGQNQTNVLVQNIRTHRTGLSESQLKKAATSKVPMSMVRNVRQAKNEDILIASYVGVYRYDRKSLPTGQAGFTNITSTIAWPTFWDVLEDRKGNIWLASQDSGVYYLPAGQAGFKHFTTEDGPGINSALHIYEDRAGNIWFGTGGGISRYDGKSVRNFTTKDGLPNNDINTFMEDKTGKLWVGTRGDLSVYDGKTFTVLKNKDGKTFTNVWGITEDKKGNIWFGATIIEDKRGDTSFVSQGLWRYDGITFTHVSKRGAYAIIQDKEGNIWTTGSNGSAGQFLKDSSGRPVWALSRYDHKSLYNKNPTVTEIKSGQPAFYGLLEANDGSIWFGGSGVYRYDGKTITDFKNEAGQQ